MAHNSAEHRLEVKRGADRLTDFAQRFQLTNRVRQLARPRLQFFEQTDVFDGDDRLIGEGLEQRDLLVGERPKLRTTDQNAPMAHPFPQQRRRKNGP